MLQYNEAAKVFDQFYQNNLIFPEQPYNLYEPCRYTLDSSGKKIRPVLCLMAYQLFHKDFIDNVFHTALSFEMFHNFTLIHDDIMDNSLVRRGRASVFSKFGSTSAILSGDVMNICAYDRLAKVDNDTHLVKLLRLFNKTAIEICEGQQLDMDFEQRDDVTLEEYIEMISLKTSVLLAACLKAGGILANTTEENIEYLYKFGIDLGIAFQIQDDYLDTFGTEEIIGKIPGGDIRASKKTILTILLRKQMGDLAFNSLMEVNSNVDENTKVKNITQAYKTHGIENIVKNHLQEYTNKSYKWLEAIAVDKDLKEPLSNLTAYLLNRKK